MAKIKQSTEVRVVDENGVIKETRTNRTIDWGKEPPYVKMYLDTILYLKDLPKGYNAILLSFLRRMNYANNPDGEQVIYVNGAMKKTIAKELKISLSRVNNALTDLVKGEAFYRIQTGEYRVNPNLFGRGDWQDIARLRLDVIFDGKGKSIMGYIESKNKRADTINKELCATSTEGKGYIKCV
ncbi:MAG: hypothetical protein K0R54_3976 [Clostridiaceae bacterium]|jgi:hypothetical protein|nr:hypothetical protein [Clostridiaceae bacterium]